MILSEILNYMKKKVHKILFPGWGVKREEYSGMDVDEIIDYGFFCEDQGPDLMDPDSCLKDIKPTKPYILIAHSMGSLFVLRNSQLRDNAEAIIIIGGFAKFAESPDNPDGKAVLEVSIMQKQLRRNPKLLLKSFNRAMAYPEHLKIDIPEMCNVSQLHHGLELLKICDIRKDIESIKVPVKILHGAKDAIVSAKLAEDLKESLQDSELNMISKSGHALPLTHAKKIKAQY